MSCGIARRCGSDPTLLWLWCRLAVTAPIEPLAWELPHATGAARKKKIYFLNIKFGKSSCHGSVVNESDKEP